MEKFIIKIAILLVIGLCISDIHSVILRLWPNTEYIKYDLFLSKSFHLQLPVIWYIYELANLLNKIIWCYVIAEIGLRFSKKLFWIGATFFLYQITQFFFYLWDRNTSFFSNIIVYCCIVILIVEILMPTKKTGIIKSME